MKYREDRLIDQKFHTKPNSLLFAKWTIQPIFITRPNFHLGSAGLVEAFVLRPTTLAEALAIDSH